MFFYLYRNNKLISIIEDEELFIKELNERNVKYGISSEDSVFFYNEEWFYSFE